LRRNWIRVHGELNGLRSLVTFQGRSVEEAAASRLGISLNRFVEKVLEDESMRHLEV